MSSRKLIFQDLFSISTNPNSLGRWHFKQKYYFPASWNSYSSIDQCFLLMQWYFLGIWGSATLMTFSTCGGHHLYLMLWLTSTIIIIIITMTSIIVIIAMTSIIINIIITCTCGTCTAWMLSLVFSKPGGLKTTKSTQKGSAPCFSFQAQIQQI